MSPIITGLLRSRVCMGHGAGDLGSDASVYGRTEKNKKKEALARCVGLSMCLVGNPTATGPKSWNENRFYS